MELVKAQTIKQTFLNFFKHVIVFG